LDFSEEDIVDLKTSITKLDGQVERILQDIKELEEDNKNPLSE